MIEYPSIINSSKAPREHCIAFDKLDGSNFRAKWTQKRGFDIFGTRTQLINEKTEFWGEMITSFQENQAKILDDLFRKHEDFRNLRENVVFGEFFGENSFAGFHQNEKHKIIVFDILMGHKNHAFLKPKEFVKKIGGLIEIPQVIYEGNLNNQFIEDVRLNKFNLKEGVICKGFTSNGAYRGKTWMCKIKTNDYLAKIKINFKEDWSKFWE